ncbi:hypothetical protein BS47DRAFT_1485914 [Hydnum rufescens UP504]|uniref:RGS domain-containing protein n=1 Tax=Hydnum rufescens UP504 TaxID=1448309 RepID=A0A9P6DWS7_9AGAM|nr:hypothetical protein BS47DRAFT_1485914 [Hydnum rufescens UP504]
MSRERVTERPLDAALDSPTVNPSGLDPLQWSLVESCHGGPNPNALKRLEEIDQAELSGRSTISVRLAEQFPASPPTLVQPPPSNSNSLSAPALLHSTIEEVGEERTSDTDPSSVQPSFNISAADPTKADRVSRPPAINTVPGFTSPTLSLRRQTSDGSLQAVRLPLPAEEPQHQPDDFLLAGIQFPAPPPSPLSPKFGSSFGTQSISTPSLRRITTRSMGPSGPPPMSPLPPIPPPNPPPNLILANRSAPATPTGRGFALNMSETESRINGRYNSRPITESKTRAVLPSSHPVHCDEEVLKSHGSPETPLQPVLRNGNLPNAIKDLNLGHDVSADESRMTEIADRPAARHADLATWASELDQDILAPTSDTHNLPDWNEIEKGGPTAVPHRQIQRDMDYSLRRLFNLQVFEQLLSDPLAQRRFRNYLLSVDESAGELDMWQDLSSHARLLEELYAHSEALHDIYLDPGSHYSVKLPPTVHREVDQALRQKFNKFESVLDPTQQHLLETMYHHQFQGFVKTKLMQQAHIKLGKHSLTNPDGLGDCFCLTNPRLRDHPIVLVSDGFNAVTGYPRNQIVGRNCRFLQGPGTTQESVQRVRDGLNSGEGCNELLLNYRRDGSPFYCLLCIIPLRDQNGQLVYFLGGQTNVTAVFAERKSSSLFDEITDDRIPIPTDEKSKYSPAMLEYKSATGRTFPSSDTLGKSAASASPGGVVAPASVDPLAHFPINEFGLTPFNIQNSPMGTKLGGMIGKLFKKPSHDADPLSLGQSPLLHGAVSGILGNNSGGGTKCINHILSQSQPELSPSLYSRLIIFKKQKREVIFVTKDLLVFLGLPHSSYRDLYSSPLVHSDLIDSLTAGDKALTKIMRTKIKNAIKADESISVEVGLKVSATWGIFPVRTIAFFVPCCCLLIFTTPIIIFQGRNESLRTGILHMTPLKEQNGHCVAYVCVFGFWKQGNSSAACKADDKFLDALGPRSDVESPPRLINESDDGLVPGGL